MLINIFVIINPLFCLPIRFGVHLAIPLGVHLEQATSTVRVAQATSTVRAAHSDVLQLSPIARSFELYCLQLCVAYFCEISNCLTTIVNYNQLT